MECGEGVRGRAVRSLCGADSMLRDKAAEQPESWKSAGVPIVARAAALTSAVNQTIPLRLMYSVACCSKECGCSAAKLGDR